MKKENKKKYATIIKELDEIISKISSPDIPIDKSIKLYEEGVKLSEQADKELILIENGINKYKNTRKSQIKKIDIENSFKEIEIFIENLEDENLKIDDAESNYKKALDIIYDIESYLKKAKSTIEKYEQ